MMTKLFYSNDFDPSVEVGMEVVENSHILKKRASTIFGLDYSDMKPDKNHVGIHVVALGDADHYPMNRNGDLFSKEACEKYTPTFVKYGHVFQHHRNKDPSIACGEIKYAAYNEPMGRVELFIHADREKAAEHLARLEKEGSVPFSMACSVPRDRCSICGALRKHAGDESECEHVRDHLGETMEDGRQVGTFNDEPRWVDISFVGRPADRIAWDLAKVASSIPESSVKAAESAGVVAPDEIALDSEAAVRKYGYLRDIASYQDSYRGWMSKSASVVTVRDRYVYELRKIAHSKLDDGLVDRLREYAPGVALSATAEAGVVMDVPTFFKYACGPQYSVVEPFVASVKKMLPSVIDSLVKSGGAAKGCNDVSYDALDPSKSYGYAPVSDSIKARLKEASCLDDVDGQILRKTAEGYSDVFSVDNDLKNVVNVEVTQRLAEKYAAYELSAIDAIVSGRNGDNKAQTLAIVSSLNLKH